MRGHHVRGRARHATKMTLRSQLVSETQEMKDYASPKKRDFKSCKQGGGNGGHGGGAIPHCTTEKAVSRHLGFMMLHQVNMCSIPEEVYSHAWLACYMHRGPASPCWEHGCAIITHRQRRHTPSWQTTERWTSRASVALASPGPLSCTWNRAQAVPWYADQSMHERMRPTLGATAATCHVPQRSRRRCRGKQPTWGGTCRKSAPR